MPHLVYIGQTPAEGTGSPVIVLRHLQRLAAAGWLVSIIAESGQDPAACLRANWSVQSLPLRRAWWPPLRRALPISRTVRTWLLAGECQRLTAALRPDAVLGYLAAHDDFYPEVAAGFARRCGAPLTLLVHDDAAAFATDAAEKTRLLRSHAWMLRQAHRCWFVSPELAAAYPLPARTRRVLPPIPADRTQFAEWQAAFALRPLVYYAGYLWPAQYPLLKRIEQTLAAAGAGLVLLTRESPELTAFLAAGSAAYVAPFPTNQEALIHLAGEAAGLLVSYADTVEQMPWTATSFPSKLVEYSQLGVPCAIVAPPESAVSRWATRDHYPDCFTPADLTPLAAWAADLRIESAWRRRSRSTRRLADGKFSPGKIQASFSAGLLRH